MSLQYTHGSYKEKLFDPRWTCKRNMILQRDGYRCVICGNTDHLVVHHKQYHFISRLGKYRDPWDYKDKYLITVCKSCHERGHYRYKVPVKNV